MKIVNLIKDQLLEVYKDPVAAFNNAWEILKYITGKAKEEIIIKKEKLNDREKKLLNQIIKRIKEDQEPIQYILGEVQFLDVKIFTKPPVLIPRVETEDWCAKLIEKIESKNFKKLNILDLCTGSGCLALALAKKFPKAKVIGVDNSMNAIKLAQKNLIKNNLKNCDFIFSDLYENILDLKFDFIIANPPYISKEKYLNLDPTVLNWEDYNALVADKNGLLVLEKIVLNAKKFLKKENSELWCEIDSDQAKKVINLFKTGGFEKIKVLKDINNKDRVIYGVLEE